jgi:lactate dehydrogenase-like 2-hydroxyacid dehydrogenase
MDIAIILSYKYKGSEWTLVGENYEGLTWLSDTTKPTEEELADLWPEVQAELAAKAQAKIDAKSSAIAKLEALGLTVEEVEVAFGLKA